MAASSSLPMMGSRLGNRRLAALALCLVLLLHITTTTLVLSSNKGKGGGAKKGGAQKGGGAQKRGGAQKGGDRKGGAPGTAGGKPRGVVHVGDAAPAAGGSFRARGSGGAITYHGGPLMTGDINLSILFYGQFTAEQKNVIQSFLRSLENTENDHVAAVHRWWDVIESYQLFTGPTPATGTPPRLRIKVGIQQSDDKYSIGKVLTLTYFKNLVKKADSGKPNTLFVFFTGSQVTVHQLCRGKCYDHGLIDNKPYLVVGNPEILCRGACGWPFQRLDYGTPNQVTVKPPNGNMGIDAMLAHFASGLAAVVTNPFNTGFFKPGPKSDPIEAGTACDNIFGSGAVPGKTGKVLVDPATGGSYNAVGEKGMKFMLPAVWNPRTSSCWTAM
ncbi:protein EXORDIUM-like 1 [Pyrus x bretschneideri]|uniref:protein EXORDIUM-like 1 n=1 Tax=Pyrus x bretschneideri TaxID=225117 RepID=UPI0020304F79|nr:protein EXORDIUM-like 1 [Pyrus x bretschneideri]